MSSLYPEMRFSWEIRSVDALFCNGMTRVGDLSREAILSSIRDEQDLSVLRDEINKNLFNDKKFCKECITVCVKDCRRMDFIEEFIDFLIGASEQTRQHVDSVIKEAIACSVKIESDQLVIGILNTFFNNKKIKAISDTGDLIEHAVYSAAVEQNSAIMQTILRWNQNNKSKKFTHKSKVGGGGPTGSVQEKWKKGQKVGRAPSSKGLADVMTSLSGGGQNMVGPKINSPAILFAAKRNDYERVKILFRYGYRLERVDKITDPLKRIELFKAITSPAYIIATLENVNDVSSEFFCPVKKCFEYACEASQKAKSMPEYKREYQEIEHRCENYAISMLEQCENLNEVEQFLETKTSDGKQHKDANYILAILDSRKKFVAHERFQYVLLKKFGEPDQQFTSSSYQKDQLLWIDMPWYSRFLHVLKQIPCYLLLFLFPFFSTCCPWSRDTTGDPGAGPSRVPWFVKQWQIPLNRCIYTAFSYMTFLLYIILYVAEVQPPAIYLIDILSAVWIISYTFRDIGTATFLWKLEDGKPIRERRFLKRYLTFWHMYNLFADFCFLIGLLLKLLEILIKDKDSSVRHFIDLNNLAAGKRILWGAAFSLAILKTIKVGIASKYFGPIILSINIMMKDVLLFLTTFSVIMLAFASGVSYIFNMATETTGTGMATAGVFQYFFWVLLQPFRGYPTYKQVAESAYNSVCLKKIGKSQTDMKELGACIVETLYNTTCIADKLNGTQSIQENEINSCLIDKDAGHGYLKSAAVPMWAVYQFLVSVVLLRILIVMMTITYRRIYDDLDKQWKYARAYSGIQFFDPNLFLPPPFTFLSMLVLLVQYIDDFRRTIVKSKHERADNGSLKGGGRDLGLEDRNGGHQGMNGPPGVMGGEMSGEPSYTTLIFTLLDKARPKPEGNTDRDRDVYSG